VPNKFENALVVLCQAYVAVLLFVTGATLYGPDRWWWAGLNMYLPQWMWALPTAVLFPVSAWYSWRVRWLLIGVLVLVTGPLMGFQWSFGKNTKTSGHSLRVMTYNVQLWADLSLEAIVSEIDAANPDILCLQDARGGESRRLLTRLARWHVVAHGQYVIASRFPIAKHAIGGLSFNRDRVSYLRATLDIQGTPVEVVTTHFLTSRDALSAFRSLRSWPEGITLMTSDLANRLSQAERLANDLRGVATPLIVGGDLNVPASSIVFEPLENVGLRDAFGESGRGYGYTFGHASKFRHSFVRIDHLLISSHFRSTRTFTGGANASDHRPVISDIVLENVLN